ncbi:hypothetical protein [Chlorobium ferrooxidans]|uniref:hypothetical protein n=1 Tax=Chlorobium ferrooxidans TaxID=84205 RepID=UPI0012EAFFC6|nr:hypothetical protein [Chlorobium ferrooxidans]
MREHVEMFRADASKHSNKDACSQENVYCCCHDAFFTQQVLLLMHGQPDRISGLPHRYVSSLHNSDAAVTASLFFDRNHFFVVEDSFNFTKEKCLRLFM